MSLITLANQDVKFYHTPIRETTENSNPQIKGSISEYNNGDKLYVLFRKLGVRSYKKIQMKNINGKNFEIRLPRAIVTIPGFEYFIVLSSKSLGTVDLFQNKWEPITVRVLKKDLSKLTKKEIDYEVFLEQQEDRKKVVSASKTSQKITESPSTITIITEKDIKDSGAYSLPDIFRSVPGMDVMYISPTDPNVSIRGFNREGANKILTLIDGRPIYFELFGTTFWEALPISVEDIEKIEIIRGPGSTLYGANAFNGVINIFTKNPQKNRGGKITSRIGNYGLTETVSSMGSDETYSYRVSGGYTKLNSFEDTDTQVLNNIKVNSSFYFISDDEKEKVSIHTGFVNGELDSLFSLIGTFDAEEYSYLYAQAIYENGGFKANLMYDLTQTTVTGGFPNPETIYAYSESSGYYNLDIKNFNIGFNNPTIGGTARRLNLDLQYQKTLFSRNKFLIGTTYRFSNFDAFGTLDNYSSSNQLGAFIQNELRLGDFIFVLGFRGDLLDVSENYTDTSTEVDNILNFSPSASLVYAINSHNVLRFSVGKAFRNPTFLESNLKINILPEVRDEAGNIIKDAVNFNGTQNAQSEKILSYELAYSLNSLNDRLKFNINLFYNIVDDLILFNGDIKSLLEVMLSRGDSITNKDSLFTFNNNVNASNYGGEVSLSWFVNQYFSFYVNYSYQKTWITNEEKLKKIYSSDDVHDITTVDLENPTHKVNIGVRNFIKGISSNIFASFVSSTQRKNFITEIGKVDNSVPILSNGSEYIAMESNASSLTHIPAWITLNASIKYTFLNDKVTLGVLLYDILGAQETISKLVNNPFDSGSNNGYKGTVKNPTGIIDGRHIEYPRSSLFGNILGGETMGRRIYGYLEIDF
jgi:outer membrane receptor protein involved in Fe transport